MATYLILSYRSHFCQVSDASVLSGVGLFPPRGVTPKASTASVGNASFGPLEDDPDNSVLAQQIISLLLRVGGQ